MVKQQYILHMSSQYGELRPTSGWDRFTSLGHPSKFQRVSRPGSVTVRHSSSGRQPNFAAFNRERHLYSAGRPSCWALAHILVLTVASKLNGPFVHMKNFKRLCMGDKVPPCSALNIVDNWLRTITRIALSCTAIQAESNELFGVIIKCILSRYL